MHPATLGTTMLTAFGPARLLTAGADDAPAVIFLHGYAACANQWLPLMEQLAPTCRILAPDLLGFGWAPAPPPPYELDRWLEQVDGLLDSLGDRPVVLAGHSLGGLVAAEAARRRPERVAGLALLSPLGLPVPLFTLASRGPMRPLTGLLRRPGVGERLFTGLRAGRHLLARPFALSPFYDRRLLPATAVDEWQTLITRPDAVHAFVDVMRRIDQLTTGLQAGEIAVPALIIWGRQDRLLPASLAAGWQTLLPQAEIVVLDRCGHLPHVEHRETVAAALLALLQQAMGRRDLTP